MSLETGNATGPESAAEAVEAPESSAVETNSGSEYSVTDPGYYDDSETETTETPSETLDDASGEEAAEETVETPAVESADFEVSDELLDKAFELGYTEEDLKKFDDVKALEKDVNRTAKLRERWVKHQAGKVPPPETAETTETVNADELQEPNWEELIEQGHDPDIIAVQKRNWEGMKSVLERSKRAEELANQVIKTEQRRAFEAQCNRFDETLDNIGDEFATIFGKGKHAELLETSPEQAANRQKVFSKMNMLRHGYLTAGERVPPEAELIQEAVHASFFKHTQQTARAKLKNDIKKAGYQALSRPNSGGAKALSGPSLALQLEQEFWKSKSL